MSRSDICARYAWTAAGPMVIGYVTWLIKRAKETKPDGILFGSRDGWILSRVFELFGKAGIRDVSMHLFDGDRHEVLNETDREEVVYPDIFAWIEKHLA